MGKSIVLRSVDPLRNRNRLYTLSIQKGILGTCLVLVRNARYGKEGQHRIYIFDDIPSARSFMIGKIRQKIRHDYKVIK